MTQLEQATDEIIASMEYGDFIAVIKIANKAIVDYNRLRRRQNENQTLHRLSVNAAAASYAAGYPGTGDFYRRLANTSTGNYVVRLNSMSRSDNEIRRKYKWCLARPKSVPEITSQWFVLFVAWFFGPLNRLLNRQDELIANVRYLAPLMMELRRREKELAALTP